MFDICNYNIFAVRVFTVNCFIIHSTFSLVIVAINLTMCHIGLQLHRHTCM